MDFLKRPLAITDVETTGLDAHLHEIIEIGLLVVDQRTLEVMDEFEAKIFPTQIKKANKKALQVNGYDPLLWANSMELKPAMEIYAEKTKGAVFFAHNVFFDWSFISEAFKKTQVEDFLDYHRADLFSSVWAHAHRLPELKKYSLENLCKHFDIPPEPMPHRAINGVRCELEVLKKIREL